MNFNKIDSVDVYDIIRGIKDPEKPYCTLEELNVVQEELVHVKDLEQFVEIEIFFVPTVPYCHLAPTIGLCLREKINKYLPKKSKIDIFIQPGTHQIEKESKFIAKI
ncbi:hypothetical protein DLAC_11579 [Tieghemostelium lacteum]|uniref:Uncharacterized protein n=1 Tax=Tieghemostelium lacteum TaxID=361077 RepID=A0A151ZSS5_TIELA|nr:hypothetical protein DLAC_11579 [Tieghemostelium lacteum]|eukprot:KYQ96955.1 hypothetical protein DLAC_11579 [Tieghemostelium lacteum]